jgi:hypothetical protein
MTTNYTTVPSVRVGVPLDRRPTATVLRLERSIGHVLSVRAATLQCRLVEQYNCGMGQVALRDTGPGVRAPYGGVAARSVEFGQGQGPVVR